MDQDDHWKTAFETVLQPERGPPAIPGLDVAVGGRWANRVPSSFSAVVPATEGKWAALVAEVAGLGLDVSLRLVQLRGLLQALCHTIERPDEVLASANGLLANEVPAYRFSTVFVGMLDVRTRILTYASAGHEPCLLRRADGDIESLKATGPILGLFPDVPFGASSPLPLASGDLVAVYNSGLSQASEGAGPGYGDTRMLDYLHESCGRGSDADSIVEGLMAEVDAFRTDAWKHDDLTALVIRARWNRVSRS